MSKRALLTGITGQDGAYLAQLLISTSFDELVREMCAADLAEAKREVLCAAS